MALIIRTKTALYFAIRWLLVTLIAVLLVLMTTQIVMRYGFNASLLWAEEMCRYLLIWLSFLGLVLAYERGEIAALNILSSAMPRVPALLLAALCALLSLALCVALVWFGLMFADLAGGSRIPAMRFILEDLFGENAPAAPQTFWIYIALPVGMALISLRLVADIVLFLRAIGTGQTLPDILSRSEERMA